MQIKLDLKFNGNLVLSGFLPEINANSLHIGLREGKYRVALYLSDPHQQLANIKDIPDDVKLSQTFLCNGLTMEIEAVAPNLEIVSALEADQPTEMTEAFGKEIFDLIIETHNGLVGYFRNIAKQFWLEPITPDPKHWQNFLHRWGTVWLDSAGQWRRFHADRDFGFIIEALILGGGVGRGTWDQVASFIEKGGQAPMTDVLISNSLKHLDQGNGRLAIVEAVIALESAFNRFLPRVVLRLPGTPQIEEPQLDRLIEKAGLRLVTNVGLNLIKAQAGLEVEDIQTVSEAIEVRNEIVHGARRFIDISRAEEYVSAIRRVIDLLEQWAIKPAKEL